MSAFINDIIFQRIEDNLVEELDLKKPTRSYKTKNNIEKDNQNPKLREYSIVLLTLAKASAYNWPIFMQLLNKTYPKKINRAEILFTQSEVNKPKLYSKFNENLIRALQVKYL